MVTGGGRVGRAIVERLLGERASVVVIEFDPRRWLGPQPTRTHILGRMPKLIYSFLASLDKYVADDAGGFDWAVPDEEVLDFINAVERDVGPTCTGASSTVSADR